MGISIVCTIGIIWFLYILNRKSLPMEYNGYIYIYKPTTIGLMTIPEMETMGVDRPTCLSQGTDRLSSTLDGFECPLVHPRPAKKEHPKASQIYHV